ncbi:MAG TPA: hypothetical protein VHI50_05235 [Micromonosporaceae bacterium]|nr:hypothetical protein [Micromonosporaceae bacterium]
MRIGADDRRYAERRWTRRALLRAAGTGAAGAAASGLTGCGLFDGDPGPESSPDPLEPLRRDAFRLAALYDAAVVAHPDLAARLNPIREAHLAHAEALATVIGGASSAAPDTAAPVAPGGDAKAALAELRAAEQDAQRTATQLCLEAPASRAALVGSIVAARACHQEALR